MSPLLSISFSTIPSSMAGMKIAFGQRDGGEAAFVGTFAINNFGGLGGGL